MAKTAVLDLFTQQLAVDLSCPKEAASTQIEAFTDAYKPQDKVGFVIQDVEYQFGPSLWNDILPTTAEISAGLSFLATVPEWGFVPASSGFITRETWANLILTAVGEVPTHEPFVRNYSHLGGGGLLAHPVNLYGWVAVHGVEVTTDFHCSILIRYFTVELTPDKWEELWQSIYARVI
jgi:hypothetical protein